MESKSKIIISGVSLCEGGILSVLQDCLTAIEPYKDQYEVYVLVHKLELVKNWVNDFRIEEFPYVKSSWLKRLYFEYYTCSQIQKKENADIWLCLQDITPRVNSKQIVYCQNPSPFYKLKLTQYFYDKTFTLFTLFYKYLYGINISKNIYVIVQQSWLRKSFYKMYGVNAIVAYPDVKLEQINIVSHHFDFIDRDKFTFFYPSFPRVFKNFEVLFEAVLLLREQRKDFKVIVTITGEENKYAKSLLKKFGNIDEIFFWGRQERELIFSLYDQVDALIFPSKLETWGLPISEFKHFKKPILVADAVYAYETVGDYEKVKFFPQDDSAKLVDYMNLLIDGNLQFDEVKPTIPEQPFFKDWDRLIDFIIDQVKPLNKI